MNCATIKIIDLTLFFFRLLTVAAVDRNSMHMLSSYCIIKISPCDEDVNILPLFVQSDNLTYHSEPGRLSTNRFDSGGGGRAFYMKGVFAVSGTTPVVVAHESIPAMVLRMKPTHSAS